MTALITALETSRYADHVHIVNDRIHVGRLDVTEWLEALLETSSNPIADIDPQIANALEWHSYDPFALAN